MKTVILQQYMNKIEYPSVVLDTMQDGEVWEGSLEDYGVHFLANRAYRRVNLDESQKKEVENYIDSVNKLIFKDADAIAAEWMENASELKGTPEQINWAEELRASALRRVAIDLLREDILEPISLARCIESTAERLYGLVRRVKRLGGKGLTERQIELVKKVEVVLDEKYPLGKPSNFDDYADEHSDEEAEQEEKRERIELYKNALPKMVEIGDATTWINNRDDVWKLVDIAFIKSLLPDESDAVILL